jgi:3-methyladenine DNA glycosylase/8-oxoguanine DNA glycosylase
MATKKPPYLAKALRHLKKSDPVLRRVIERVGPCALRAHDQDTFEALAQSIVYQQLNGKAAATIHARVMKVLGGKATPKRLQAASDADLRAAGLSANKLRAMRDLAEKCLSGAAPPRKALEPLTDAEIVDKLVEVRGIGEWTVQMFLMFRLGRPDVLPTGDYGIRKAFGLLYRKNGKLPPPTAVAEHGKRWAPYRTVASWYLWRTLDSAGGA